MKTVVAASSALVLGIALLPAVLANGDPPPVSGCGVQAGPIEVVLATIREVESGGDYRAQARGSSASGAYAFLDSSWNGYGGYAHAKDAPPSAQDTKAADLARSILDRHGGDASVVPVSWYIGHVPDPGSPEWDTIPVPSAGNRLTPRQYQAKWMAAYERLLGAGSATENTVDGVAPGASCIGGAVAPIDVDWSLP